MPMANRLHRDQRIVGVMQDILADDVYVTQSRINFQLPFEGSGFYWHSDFETWNAEDGMPAPRAASAVVFLEPNLAANGCIMVMPGSHKDFVTCPGETPERNWETSLKAQQVLGTPSHEHLAYLSDKCGIVYAEGNPGDVLFFDCNLMHGSHNNISPLGRCNMFFVYNAVSNALGTPTGAPTPRPEHIATRDPEWVRPIQPVSGTITERA